MTWVPEPLAPTQETWMEFPAPGFSLWPYGECINKRKTSFSSQINESSIKMLITCWKDSIMHIGLSLKKKLELTACVFCFYTVATKQITLLILSPTSHAGESAGWNWVGFQLFHIRSILANGPEKAAIWVPETHVGRAGWSCGTLALSCPSPSNACHLETFHLSNKSWKIATQKALDHIFQLIFYFY